jgi:hypothetical protein
MKIVINKCYGGFGLSKLAQELYADKKGLNLGKYNKTWGYYEGGDFYDREIPRDDADLVSIVESLGSKANGSCADLRIIEIPEGVNWQIEEYDGIEWIAEQHRTWD